MAFDNSFTITHVEDLALAIKKILFKTNYNVYHLASSQIIKRVDLADFIIKNSRRGQEMSYQRVPFSEIKYSEPRSRLNHLKSQIKFVKEEITFRTSRQTILEKVVNDKSNDPFALNVLGLVYLKNESIDRAKKLFDRAITINPKYCLPTF